MNNEEDKKIFCRSMWAYQRAALSDYDNERVVKTNIQLQSVFYEN